MPALPLLDFFRSQTEAIGFCAGVLTTIAFAPQLLKAWKTGGEGLSWAMLALFGTGVGLWFVYGLLRISAPIAIANALTGAQVVAIFAIKVRHAWARRPASARVPSRAPAAGKSGLR